MRSLSEVGWLRGHGAALYWLGMLYRKPKLLEAAAKELSGTQAVGVGLKLYFHALPYDVFLILCLRVLLFEALGAPIDQNFMRLGGLARLSTQLGIGLAGGLLGGLVVAIGFGRGFALVGGLGVALSMSLVFSLVGGLAFGHPFGLFFGFIGGLGVSLLVGLGIPLSVGLVGGLVGGVVVGLVAGYVAGLVVGLSYFSALLRLYYWPLFWWLSWPKPRGKLYRWHPVAWDDLCPIPYPGLARLLLDYATHERRAAETEIERLVNEYPAQRGAALKVRTILVARDASKIARFAELEPLVARLPEGKRGYLAQTERLRELALELVALASRATAAEVPALRAAEAAELCLRIRDFRDQVAGFAEPLASEFRQASLHWLQLAEAMKTEARTEAEYAPPAQVFRAGDKVVDRDREAFVLRGAVLQELQQQLLLATGCPGIVLYGRRRVGKSSVLCNVDGFLPSNIRSCVVSLQDPRAFTDVAGFCRELYAAIGRALAKPPRQLALPAGDSPLTLDALHQFLDQTNHTLAQTKERLILALDEYENLDRKLGDGVFPIDLLHCLRESLQSHREIIWILAGSHEISELSHADWTSYLVSARTVEVPMFTPAETRALLTDPMKHAPRREEIWQERPRFEPEFWGPQGIDAIHEQAGGWPHLVQLLAEALLDLVSIRSAAKVDAEIYAESLDKAVARGYNVFSQLLYGECPSDAEREYIAQFKRVDVQAPPTDDAIARSLRRRLLIAENGSEWRLRVPLMQQWLRQRG